jgi:hypothetical protein
MANEILSSNAVSAIPKLVSARFLPALVGNLVMGNLVNRDFEATIQQAGDVVNVPIPPSLAANNIAEAGQVTNQNASLGNAQIALSTHAEATFTITDIAKVLAQPDLLAMYMQPAVIALAKRIEGDLLNLYPAFTANSSVGTSNTALTEAVVTAPKPRCSTLKFPRMVRGVWLLPAPHTVSFARSRVSPNSRHPATVPKRSLVAASSRRRTST